MATLSLRKRIEALEAKRAGGGLWLLASYADDPDEQRKIDRAEQDAIAAGASPASLFVAVRRFNSPEGGKFPDKYSARAA